MATLRIPFNHCAAMLADTVYGIVSGNANTTNYQISGNNTSTSACTLTIYRGAIESFPAFTDRASRSSDVLITFNIPGLSAGYNVVGAVGTAHRVLIGKHLANQTASASGVATWFMLSRNLGTSLTNVGALIGTVGLSGSGADLEIPDTSIVSGANYQSAGFFVNVPTNWTV